MSAAGTNSDAPPPYQEAADGSRYPNDPPPKYEPPQVTNVSYHNVYGQHNNGYQTIVTVSPNNWGPDPQRIHCPFCNATVTTLTQYESGSMTWLTSGLLCLFGLWFGCCAIPFCVNSLKDVKHKCPNCQRLVGVFRRLE